jgi:hypothetical protein
MARRLVLERENRHHAGDVAVAGALAVAVDRALHVRRADVDRRQRVRDPEADVVVRVDADARLEMILRVARDFGDFGRQRAAVRIAQRHHVRAGAFGGEPRRERVLAIFLAAIERVFRVVDDELAVRFEVSHGVGNHRQVFVARRLDDFAHVQRPRLAENRDHRGFGVEQQAHLIVGLDLDVFAARRSERRQPRTAERTALGLLEELDVARIRARPATLDVMDPECVQSLGNAQFVGHGKRDAFALRAVAEGGVVDLDLGNHGLRQLYRDIIEANHI